MKYLLLTLLILGISIALGIFLTNLLFKNKKRNIKIILNILFSFMFILGAAFGYLLPYQKEETIVYDYCVSDNDLAYVDNDDYYAFINKAADKALIFYSGAKVSEYAYSPLMNKIAKANIDVYVLKLPFHMAIFNSAGAKRIIENNNYQEIYLGGHSLGGVVASSIKNDKIIGLILLASYPNKKIENISLLSIYGSNDGILNIEEYDKNRLNWPKDSQEYVIEGGNHSGFAYYGFQKGDNEANISNDAQIDISAKEIINFIHK